MIKVKPSIVTRTTHVDRNKEPISEPEEEGELLEPVVSTRTAPAIVKYGGKITISKNYQSYAIDVGVEYPCTVSEIPEAFKKAEKLVEAKIAEKLVGAHKLLEKKQ